MWDVYVLFRLVCNDSCTPCVTIVIWDCSAGFEPIDLTSKCDCKTFNKCDLCVDSVADRSPPVRIMSGCEMFKCFALNAIVTYFTMIERGSVLLSCRAQDYCDVLVLFPNCSNVWLYRIVLFILQDRNSISSLCLHIHIWQIHTNTHTHMAVFILWCIKHKA